MCVDFVLGDEVFVVDGVVDDVVGVGVYVDVGVDVVVVYVDTCDIVVDVDGDGVLLVVAFCCWC